VHELVHHHEVESLLRGHGLVHVTERGDPDTHEIERDGVRRPGGVIPEILEEDVDFFSRSVVKQAALEAEGVLKAADDVRDQVLVGF